MVDGSNMAVGQRIREVRAWRDVSLRTTAGLAGISPAYLSLIESGERPVNKRETLEAIARALRVAPSTLSQLPHTATTDPEVSRAVEDLVDLEAALTDAALGEVTVVPREWEPLAADVARLQGEMRLKGDLVAQMAVLPTLIRELQAVVGNGGPHKLDALHALLLVLRAASSAAKRLQAQGTPGFAALRMREVAHELDTPRALGLADLARAQTLGSGGRARMRSLSLDAVDRLDDLTGDTAIRQLVGMLHLNAAMASSALDEYGRAGEHLDEARRLAEAAPDPDGAGWAGLSFCRTNVAFWEVATAIECDDAGKVDELSAGLAPESMASWERQAAYWADMARAWSTVPGRREEAAEAMVRAEALAPVTTRTNVWARQTTTFLLRKTNRDDALGRELRGVAFRMGMAV